MTITDGAHDTATTSTFPTRWERPEDELTFWAQDRMAFPEPIPPLVPATEQCVRRLVVMVIIVGERCDVD